MTDTDDRVAALEARIADLEAENHRLETRVEDLETRVEELEAEVRERSDHIEDLESDNEDLRARVAELERQPEVSIEDPADPIGSLQVGGAPVGRAINSKPSETDLDAELAQLREELEAYAEGDDAPTSDPTADPETPLEQVVAMPEDLVDEQLTANQKRARFVARDITEYASKTPAGWVLRPKDLRTVLNAAFDTGHSQTCSRVREILADLGDEEVSIQDSRGERKLVFEERIVERLHQLAESDHDVVSTAEV
jgi:chaperonin cofactor prefoldin